MRLGILLVVAAIPFIELALLIRLGQAIGFWLTLAVIAATAVIGTYVINRQSFSVMQKAMDAVQGGRAPVASVVEGFLLIVAGLLLVTPGLMTDVVGLLLIFPPARRWIAINGLRRLLKSKSVRIVIFGEDPVEVRRGTGGSGSFRAGQKAEAGDRRDSETGQVIEGEYERISERTVDPKRGRKD